MNGGELIVALMQCQDMEVRIRPSAVAGNVVTEVIVNDTEDEPFVEIFG